MWQLIKLNQQRSVLLFFLLGICLLAFGFTTGIIFGGLETALIFTLIAVFIFLIISVISLIRTNHMMIDLLHSRRVTKRDFPLLYNIVQEMTIASNLSNTPEILIVPIITPNAYTAGSKRNQSVIVITLGLLVMLNRDELQGVIAHEMAHIVNHDSNFMLLVNQLYLIISFFPRTILNNFERQKTTDSNGYSINRNSPGEQTGGLLALIFFVFFSFLLAMIARMIYTALSSKREYLADACAVRFTRYPVGLANALEKLSKLQGVDQRLNLSNSPLYIVEPESLEFPGLLQPPETHPPITNRIKILRSLGSVISFSNYTAKYNQVLNVNKTLFPRDIIEDETKLVTKQKDTAESNILDPAVSLRKMKDIIHYLDNHFIVKCTCGLKIKLPKDFPCHELHCPRCGYIHYLDKKEFILPEQVIQDQLLSDTEEPVPDPAIPLVYNRTPDPSDWESFNCLCGSPKHLSPNFRKKYFYCTNCGRKIILR